VDIAMNRKSIAFSFLLGLSLTLSIMLGRPDKTAANSSAPSQASPTLSINDVSLVEGNSGVSSMVFTVTLTASGARPTIGVAYSTADGPPPSGASAPSDYTTVANALIFPSGTGSTTMTISVPINGDSNVEPDEIFVVNLGPADGATITDAQGTGTIINDDSLPPLRTLSISNVSVTEGNSGVTNAVLTVSISAASASAVMVDYVTNDGTAMVGDNDYTPISGTLTFPAGDSSPRIIEVPIVGDAKNEPDEHFSVSLVNAVHATIADGFGDCTIVNDDSSSLPELSIFDGALEEGTPAPVGPGVAERTVPLRVLLSNQTTSDITVDYVVVDGTATLADNDYTTTSGTLTLPAGSFAQLISIAIVADSKIEPDEFFTVSLSNPVGATIGDGNAKGTIITDDCVFSLSPANAEISLSGTKSETNSFSVITEPDNSDCKWSAVSNDPWIRIIAQHNDEVEYQVDPNRGPRRAGTITAGGQIFTVDQSGICPPTSYSVFRPNATAAAGGGSGSITVTAPSNCGWRATTNANWISIVPKEDESPGDEGRGNGEIRYLVEGISPGVSHRSGAIIINEEIQHTVNQAADGCPLEWICGVFPGICVDNEDTLSKARSFRDTVLAKTPRGQRYTRLYYRFSTEAVSLMVLNPMLIVRSQEMLQRYRPVLDSMINNEPVTLTEGDIQEIERLLNSFASKGSPEFRETLKSLCEDLRDPILLTEFKITITDGSARELPARGIPETVKQTGVMIFPLGLLIFCIYQTRSRSNKAKAVNKR
jgi:hypothetical protein